MRTTEAPTVPRPATPTRRGCVTAGFPRGSKRVERLFTTATLGCPWSGLGGGHQRGPASSGLAARGLHYVRPGNEARHHGEQPEQQVWPEHPVGEPEEPGRDREERAGQPVER